MRCSKRYSLKQSREHLDVLALAYPLLQIAGLLILPTCQHAKMDLVQTGQLVEDEKDALLEKVCLPELAQLVDSIVTSVQTLLLISCPVQFMEFAKGVCNKATDRGYWADYIDPCSGLPVGGHL